MSKERPIIFSGDMVRAILGGRKTQTRRVVRHDLVANADICNIDKNYFYVEDRYGDSRHITDFCPCGKVGDRLWVREAWSILLTDGHLTNMPTFEHQVYHHSGVRIGQTYFDGEGKIVYYADGNEYPTHIRHKSPNGWRPSINMPRWASRILLEITNVRVEKLKDISPTNAMNEGMPFGSLKPRQEFLQRWDAIKKKRGYGSENNPYVWVIEFKTI